MNKTLLVQDHRKGQVRLVVRGSAAFCSLVGVQALTAGRALSGLATPQAHPAHQEPCQPPGPAAALPAHLHGMPPMATGYASPGCPGENKGHGTAFCLESAQHQVRNCTRGRCTSAMPRDDRQLGRVHARVHPDACRSSVRRLPHLAADAAHRCQISIQAVALRFVSLKVARDDVEDV